MTEPNSLPLALETKPEEVDAMLALAKNYIYINASFVTSSNWDVRLIFAERLPHGGSELRAAIVMSHAHAKAFSKVLSGTVQKLEAAIGEIRYEPIAPAGAKKSEPDQV